MPADRSPLAAEVSAAPSPTDRPPLSTVRVVVAVIALAIGGFAIGNTEFVTMGVLPDIAQGAGVDIPTARHHISHHAPGVVGGAPGIAALTARPPPPSLPVALCGAPCWSA